MSKKMKRTIKSKFLEMWRDETLLTWSQLRDLCEMAGGARDPMVVGKIVSGVTGGRTKPSPAYGIKMGAPRTKTPWCYRYFWGDPILFKGDTGVSALQFCFQCDRKLIPPLTPHPYDAYTCKYCGGLWTAAEYFITKIKILRSV